MGLIVGIGNYILQTFQTKANFNLKDSLFSTSDLTKFNKSKNRLIAEHKMDIPFKDGLHGFNDPADVVFPLIQSTFCLGFDDGRDNSPGVSIYFICSKCWRTVSTFICVTDIERKS